MGVNLLKKKHGKANDKHHLFYPRVNYGKGSAYSLRTSHYCIVQVPRNTLHRQIHTFVTNVPVPSEEGARLALEQLKILEENGVIRGDDCLEKRLAILIFLFTDTDQLTADALKEQLKVIRKFRPP